MLTIIIRVSDNSSSSASSEPSSSNTKNTERTYNLTPGNSSYYLMRDKLNQYQELLLMLREELPKLKDENVELRSKLNYKNRKITELQHTIFKYKMAIHSFESEHHQQLQKKDTVIE